jgi:membrane-bound lytic murein transglycosylase B
LPLGSNGEPKQPFALIPLETPEEPTRYWIGYQNFYVITRYNQSSFYAMSVFQLGEALEKRMKNKR